MQGLKQQVPIISDPSKIVSPFLRNCLKLIKFVSFEAKDQSHKPDETNKPQTVGIMNCLQNP